MKQGTNFHLTVTMGINLDLVEKITFLFKQQSGAKLTFTYPSDIASRIDDTNQIKLQWTREETYSFNANEYVMMDSLIELIDSSDNPQTEVVKFSINPTLFEEGDI